MFSLEKWVDAKVIAWALLAFALSGFVLPHEVPAADVWAPSPLDERKALPNNAMPPSRVKARQALPSLPSDQEGTIRSVRLPQGVKAVAFTFDMCELATVTTGCDMDVVNVLRNGQIPATLFMGGKWMRTHASRVRQLMREPLFK